MLMEASKKKRRDHRRLLWAYADSVIHHWLGLSALAVVGVAEGIRARFFPEWTVASWIRVAAWLAALMPAQYLAWLDAWEAKGTPEKPFASKGLHVTWHMGHEDYYDEEDPYAPPTPGPPCSYTRIKADAELRGRALEVYFNEDFDRHEVHVYCVKPEGKTLYLPRIVQPLAAQSFTLDMRGYTLYPPVQFRELEIRIERTPLPKVVRVEEVSRPGRLASWFQRSRTKSN